MIQRKQTVFLLLALIVTLVCLCLPVGNFVPQTMGVDMPVYNLWVVDGNGGHNLSVWPTFAILLVTCPLALAAIFLYKNRKLQAKICVLNILFLIGWYLLYIYNAKTMGDTLNASFHVTFAASLPLISLILHVMALRGIKADEALIKSMDRIR